MKLPVDRDTRRRWIDVAMGVAAFVCVVIAIIPLGSILLEASIRGLRSLSPALLTSTTGGGGIGNAIQGTLILILLSALVSLPVGMLIGDTNADRFCDAVDVAQVKSQSGKQVTNANFREDVNVDGFIDAVDTALTKSKSGTALQ